MSRRDPEDKDNEQVVDAVLQMRALCCVSLEFCWDNRICGKSRTHQHPLQDRGYNKSEQRNPKAFGPIHRYESAVQPDSAERRWQNQAARYGCHPHRFAATKLVCRLQQNGNSVKTGIQNTAQPDKPALVPAEQDRRSHARSNDNDPGSC